MARPIVYGAALSPYVWSVRLALAEKGVVHELVSVGIGEFRSEAHLARHPFGKIPAFEHDGFMLYETQAIMRYVDEAFPAAPLQPIEVQPFARMNQIMGVVDNYLTPCLLANVIFQRMVAPLIGRTTDEEAVGAALPRVRHCLGEIARLAGDQEFLAGDTITLADLMAIPQIYYFKKFPEGAAQLAELPALAAWARRMEERQSLQVTRPAGV
ncbi:MAG TPA: glutathione S-transferase family protein [Stellaceae bacterium]|jgi:glutathione S-transferase|nr:glutathione S-transferase family protein [Stellaceae bacterium]